MSMADRDGYIWYDGKLVPWRDANTHVLTHTLHYGLGVFEGVRCYATAAGPAIFRLRDHTDRLFRSAQIFGMKIPYGKDTIDAAQKECVRSNGLDSCYLRPLAFYGSEAMGVAARSNPVRVAIAAVAAGARIWVPRGWRRESASRPRRSRTIIRTLRCARRRPFAITRCRSWPTRKPPTTATRKRCCSTRRATSARARARTCSSCATASCTPPTWPAARSTAYTRSTIMTFAADLGIAVVERRITRDEFYIADEAFFTGTAAEVTPIRELDNRPIGTGQRGPITQLLQALFFDVVNGRNAKYRVVAHRRGLRCPSIAYVAPRRQRAARR